MNSEEDDSKRVETIKAVVRSWCSRLRVGEGQKVGDAEISFISDAVHALLEEDEEEEAEEDIVDELISVIEGFLPSYDDE